MVNDLELFFLEGDTRIAGIIIPTNLVSVGFISIPNLLAASDMFFANNSS